MDWEARMSMRTWTKQMLAEAEAITRDPEGQDDEGTGFEFGTYDGFTVTPFGGSIITFYIGDDSDIPS